MSSFVKGLGLDLFDFKEKLISIIEEHNADASFCLSCFMWQALSNPDTGVCLVALHHSLRHYYHVGMRLGYNLSRAYGTNFVAVDAVNIREAHVKDGKEIDFSLKIVVRLVQQRMSALKSSCQKVFLLVDDVSDFLNLGVPLNDVLLFIQYITICYKDNATIVICTHSHNEDEEQVRVKNMLLHSADLRLVIKCLGTGFSKEVTGSIELTKASGDAVKGWSEPMLYHYKTKERNINIFLPGNISFSY